MRSPEFLRFQDALTNFVSQQLAGTDLKEEVVAVYVVARDDIYVAGDGSWGDAEGLEILPEDDPFVLELIAHDY